MFFWAAQHFTTGTSHHFRGTCGIGNDDRQTACQCLQSAKAKGVKSGWHHIAVSSVVTDFRVAAFAQKYAVLRDAFLLCEIFVFVLLAVAADGRASPLREAKGITAEITRYGQKALAFVVTHAVPHDNVSTEIYLSGGAFTLVPLADHDGQPASAVVWMNDGRRAAELASMDAEAFSDAATERSTGVLGRLSLVTQRRSWPVVTQRATALVAERTVILAEAAHVLPPIGAQGLNTSLHDVASLVNLAAARPDGLGDQTLLTAYAKARATDIHARAKAIDLFNRVCRSHNPSVQALRGLGLKLVHDVAPLRKGVMRAGMGG